MNKEILILGKGFIGNRIKEALNCQIFKQEIRIFRDAERIVKEFNPKILINCVGNTGKNNVDGCELEKDKTLMANTFVPIILAEVALRNKIKLIHISSGCIYQYDYRKDKPITESIIPDYFDLFYSRTKIYSERALEVLSNKYNFLIVRIRVPLDDRPHPRNLITKLIKYKRVIDIPNSITYIPDFLKALSHLIKIDAKGIYNIVNKGSLRYPTLLNIYRKYVTNINFKTIDYKKLNLSRTNLILSTHKLEKAGFKMKNISEVLEECVKAYLKY